MLDDQLNSPQDGNDDDLQKLGNESQEDAEKNTTTGEAPFTHDHNLGQQDALGGSESAPETDDDVDEMRARMGLGGDTDDKGPVELNTAEQMNKAEAANQGFDTDDIGEDEDHEE